MKPESLEDSEFECFFTRTEGAFDESNISTVAPSSNQGADEHDAILHRFTMLSVPPLCTNILIKAILTAEIVT